MIRILLAAFALSLASAATAHSFWLEPEQYRAADGEEVRVDFRIGDVGEAGDWGLFWERIVSLRSFDEDGMVDQQRAVRVTGPGEPGGAVVNLRGEGTHVIAFESTQSFSDLEAERFNRYIGNEGLASVIAHRERTGRTQARGTELYSRRAKTLVQVGDRLTDNVLQPIGQTLEIVPLVHPGRLTDSGQLPVRVLWRGQPLSGAQVMATALDSGDEHATVRTNEEGVATVPIAGDGSTLIAVVWSEPAPNDARADYTTVFASLTVGAP